MRLHPSSSPCSSFLLGQMEGWKWDLYHSNQSLFYFFLSNLQLCMWLILINFSFLKCWLSAVSEVYMRPLQAYSSHNTLHLRYPALTQPHLLSLSSSPQGTCFRDFLAQQTFLLYGTQKGLLKHSYFSKYPFDAQ